MTENLDGIATVLRNAGLRVVECGDWLHYGYAGQDLEQVRGVLWHHTATNRAQFVNSNAPTLGMLINGRSDLAGPLCNLGLGRDGTVYIVATGVANHAGRGSAPGIPTDMGNHYLIGIEMESSGVAPWDWTPAQLRAAPILGAALEKAYLQRFPPAQRLQLAHYEYSSEGKIDPAGWPGSMDGLRASINKALAAPVAPKPVPAPKPTPAPPALKPPAKTSYVPDPHWVVDPGDTLGKIAAWAGTSVATLAHYNGLKDPNKLRVGEWIWPPVGRGTWTVDPGDTVASISKYYGNAATVQEICFATGINDVSKLRVGQRLQIPV
jgi:LysM repeat protein